MRFNRTFMELKSYDKYVLLSPLASFNRTFMELKFINLIMEVVAASF